MRSFSEDRQVITGINITPFVDIVLVILVIFMLAAPMVYRKAWMVNLPKSSHGQSEAHALLLRLGSGKEIFLEDRRLTPLELRQELETLAQRDPALHILVAADQSLPYGEIVGLLDIARDAGVSKIALRVRPK